MTNPKITVSKVCCRHTIEIIVSRWAYTNVSLLYCFECVSAAAVREARVALRQVLGGSPGPGRAAVTGRVSGPPGDGLGTLGRLGERPQKIDRDLLRIVTNCY